MEKKYWIRAVVGIPSQADLDDNTWIKGGCGNCNYLLRTTMNQVQSSG